MPRQKKDLHFRITFVNDSSHEQLWMRRFNLVGLVLSSVAVLIVGAAAIYALIAFTPIRTTIPGYPDALSRQKAIQNAMRIDSLENLILRWEFYTDNFKRIVEGETPIDIDSLITNRSDSTAAIPDAKDLAIADSVLRASVQQEEQFDVNAGAARSLPLEGIHFFCPLKGVVSRHYDKLLHPYVDITAPANSVVMAALDGNVIFTDWNDAAGYTLVIQHEGDLISIYKHNQKLLKTTGDQVKAGTPIGLVGSAADSGDHLHFELWHKGHAVDPETYIVF